MQEKYEKLKIIYNKQLSKLEIADRNMKDLELKYKNMENQSNELRGDK